ncbi:NAD(P)H-binding protein [Streptomycetaceae bacterium NBC_01309]
MPTLVTGATGNTGRHLVAELLRRGEQVRALSRDPAAAARLPAGVELASGTHNEPRGLGAALDGVDRLHITVTAGLADVGAELVRRAVDVGVRRITVVWGGAVGPVEEAVAASGVEWTRLEPQEFNFAETGPGSRLPQPASPEDAGWEALSRTTSACARWLAQGLGVSCRMQRRSLRGMTR